LLCGNSLDEGAGLGVAIAEGAVHAHRGTIRAMNAPAGGLIVEINLPIT
jgi:K+-sensing histidine kinase KdpD